MNNNDNNNNINTKKRTRASRPGGGKSVAMAIFPSAAWHRDLNGALGGGGDILNI